MPSKLTVVKTADIIHKNSGRSFLAVFLDIARSYFEYGSSFENYLDFNFEASESGKRRDGRGQNNRNARQYSAA